MANPFTYLELHSTDAARAKAFYAKLARAAEEALQKIEGVLPPRLKQKLAEAALYAPDFHIKAELRPGLSDLRQAVREQKKARFRSVDKTKAGSERTVQPLGLDYWGQTWTLAGGVSCGRGFATSGSTASRVFR